MNTLKKSLGIFIIASAIIWGAVLIVCSLKLKGTGCYDQISTILSLGAGLHLILIWGPLAVLVIKPQKK